MGKKDPIGLKEKEGYSVGGELKNRKLVLEKKAGVKKKKIDAEEGGAG